MLADSSVATVAAAIRTEAERRRAGERLPSTREFTRRLGVSPVTVSPLYSVPEYVGVWDEVTIPS